MKLNDYFTIKGYLSLLETRPPNGRYNHEVANKISGLRLALKVDLPITGEYEAEVKELIHKLTSV